MRTWTIPLAAGRAATVSITGVCRTRRSAGVGKSLKGRGIPLPLAISSSWSLDVVGAKQDRRSKEDHGRDLDTPVVLVLPENRDVAEMCRVKTGKKARLTKHEYLLDMPDVVTAEVRVATAEAMLCKVDVSRRVSRRVWCDSPPPNDVSCMCASCPSSTT
jgi:hypothetical protein